ncbi:MAG: hypothetical protein ACM4D3_18330 [Candidatus Sericytochromatia bacterium]
MKRDENRPRLIAGTARLDKTPKQTRGQRLRQRRLAAQWQQKTKKGKKMTAPTAPVVSVRIDRTREGDPLIRITEHQPFAEFDEPTAEIGLDPAAAARLAAGLCSAVYQSVYVAAGTQDSDAAGPVAMAIGARWKPPKHLRTNDDRQPPPHPLDPLRGRGGEPMTAPAEFHCSACQRRIARRGKHWVTGGAAMILCTSCKDSPEAHRRLFPTCRAPHESCADHVHPVTTRAGATYLKTAHERDNH